MNDDPSARQPKPTAKAVAELANVSVSTVSRVMNDRADDIAPATRARVQAAASKLRYRPNSLAAALRKGYTRTVGLVVPDIADDYFHAIARGVDDAAHRAGYTMVLCNADRSPEKERSTIRALYDQSVDAIIFAGGGLEDEAHLTDLPWDLTTVVTVGPHQLPFPNVRVDDVGTIKMAMRHMFDEGCRRVLCIAGMRTWQITAERLQGYREALEEQGIAYDESLVFEGEFRIESGRRSVEDALERGVEFDGVMSFNDYSAVGALQVLQERGLRVPDDVAVVGCDDILLASYVSPALTSVSFPQYDFGFRAMEMSLELIAGRPVDESVQLDYHLEIRESSRRRR